MTPRRFEIPSTRSGASHLKLGTLSGHRALHSDRSREGAGRPDLGARDQARGYRLIVRRSEDRVRLFTRRVATGPIAIRVLLRQRNASRDRSSSIVKPSFPINTELLISRISIPTNATSGGAVGFRSARIERRGSAPVDARRRKSKLALAKAESASVVECTFAVSLKMFIQDYGVIWHCLEASRQSIRVWRRKTWIKAKNPNPRHALKPAHSTCSRVGDTILGSRQQALRW